MRKTAFVCLMDIQSLCVYQNELFINPHVEELLHALSDEYVQRSTQFNHIDLIIFAPSRVFDCKNKVYFAQSESGDSVSIDFEDIELELKIMSVNFHTQLNAESNNEKRNRLYFHEPKFLALDEINPELLQKSCDVVLCDQILFISNNQALLKEAEKCGSMICPLYNEGDWNAEDLQSVLYYSNQVSFSQITLSISESCDTTQQQKKCLDYFSKQFPEKKISLIKSSDLDLSKLEEPDQLVVHFEQNPDRALSLSLQYESLSCHIIRVYSRGQLHSQLPLMIAKWLKIETKELVKNEKEKEKIIFSPILKASATQTDRIEVTTESSQTEESFVADEIEGFDSCCDIKMVVKASSIPQCTTQHPSSQSAFFREKVSSTFHQVSGNLKDLKDVTSQTWTKLSDKFFGSGK